MRLWGTGVGSKFLQRPSRLLKRNVTLVGGITTSPRYSNQEGRSPTATWLCVGGGQGVQGCMAYRVMCAAALSIGSASAVRRSCKSEFLKTSGSLWRHVRFSSAANREDNQIPITTMLEARMFRCVPSTGLPDLASIRAAAFGDNTHKPICINSCRLHILNSWGTCSSTGSSLAKNAASCHGSS